MTAIGEQSEMDTEPSIPIANCATGGALVSINAGMA